MPIRIRELRVEDGRMDFADFSIQPNFAADVTGLNGTVVGMSTDPKARAKVDLKGRVGEFSPVTIAGDVQPFAYADEGFPGILEIPFQFWLDGIWFDVNGYLATLRADALAPDTLFSLTTFDSVGLDTVHGVVSVGAGGRALAI